MLEWQRQTYSGSRKKQKIKKYKFLVKPSSTCGLTKQELKSSD